jgi:hypothetical protein
LLPSADFLEDRYAAITASPSSDLDAGPSRPPIDALRTPRHRQELPRPRPGQFLFEIFIRTLGDGNRWSESPPQPQHQPAIHPGGTSCASRPPKFLRGVKHKSRTE